MLYRTKKHIIRTKFRALWTYHFIFDDKVQMKSNKYFRSLKKTHSLFILYTLVKLKLIFEPENSSNMSFN